MATIAPELPGALEVIERLVARGRRRVGRPHRRRHRRRCVAAVEAGARCVTHLGNAMPPMLTREPGPVGVALGGCDLVAGRDRRRPPPRPATSCGPPGARSGPTRFLSVSDTTAGARPARRADPARRPGRRRRRRHGAAPRRHPRRLGRLAARLPARPGRPDRLLGRGRARHRDDDPARAARPAAARGADRAHRRPGAGADGGRPARAPPPRSAPSRPTRSRRWSAPDPPPCSGWRPARARCRRTRSWSAGTAPAPARRTTRCRCFTLDEYVGLPRRPPGDLPGDDLPRAHRRARASPATGCAARTPSDVRARGRRATRTAIVAAGGVDLQVLGIGADGHLAFNEPGSSLASATRIKTLTEQTRRDNARFFGSVDEVPRHVLTQGLGTILRARHLLLVATGAGKAAAVAAAVEGPLSASCPASVLQLHPHATVLLDAGRRVRGSRGSTTTARSTPASRPGRGSSRAGRPARRRPGGPRRDRGRAWRRCCRRACAPRPR